LLLASCEGLGTAQAMDIMIGLTGKRRKGSFGTIWVIVTGLCTVPDWRCERTCRRDDWNGGAFPIKTFNERGERKKVS